jgi:copper chaperone CopZ
MPKIVVFLFTFIGPALFSPVGVAAQIKHAKTVNVKIYGNCGMCEKVIEKAATEIGVSKADWLKESQMARITFDSTRTTLDNILQNVAAAGYDSDQYRAPDDVYEHLHACCHYERPPQLETPKPFSDTPKPRKAPTGMVKKQAGTQPDSSSIKQIPPD